MMPNMVTAMGLEGPVRVNLVVGREVTMGGEKRDWTICRLNERVCTWPLLPEAAARQSEQRSLAMCSA